MKQELVDSKALDRKDRGKPYISGGRAYPYTLAMKLDWWSCWNAANEEFYHKLCVVCKSVAEARTILTSKAATSDGWACWLELKAAALGQASGESMEELLRQIFNMTSNKDLRLLV